ncbi:YqaJ-like recombinase protein [Pseudaminobacter salicylatoxidans]|uniref:YqaJ-like recombinase protein n=1 Tax=Pseudaminobacter salicylatoxidans TaxID=93369 RepID=A0A316C1Z9_PSESE|nr:lambda exonuclease family protein [Pseudaminobacter salicylatoxidans]PWJ81554.1 YqaJ-like recombinase protein [Pseudaminobacter salicylatoxidans]
MQVFDCDQGTPEWYACRVGIATASMFATVMASGVGGAASKTRAKYMRQLAGEVITGKPTEGYTNSHMERGHAVEPEARKLYAFLTNAEVKQVGFIRNGEKGCSPDSLVGQNGMLEIKSKLPDLVIECIERGTFPPEHKAQCQGALWVAEREWIDIAVYWPGMPFFIKRAYRDETYIAEMSRAVAIFNEELAALVDRIRAYEPEPVPQEESPAIAKTLLAG